jgi:hypothetical protein
LRIDGKSLLRKLFLDLGQGVSLCIIRHALTESLVVRDTLLQGRVLQEATEVEVFLHDLGLLSVGVEMVFVGKLHVGYSITTMEKIVKGLASPSPIVFFF